MSFADMPDPRNRSELISLWRDGVMGKIGAIVFVLFMSGCVGLLAFLLHAKEPDQPVTGEVVAKRYFPESTSYYHMPAGDSFIMQEVASPAKWQITLLVKEEDGDVRLEVVNVPETVFNSLNEGDTWTTIP